MGKKRIISISTSLTHPVRTKNHSVCQLCLATSPQPLHFFALEPIQHTEHQRNLKRFQDFLWLPKLLEEFDKLIERTAGLSWAHCQMLMLQLILRLPDTILKDTCLAPTAMNWNPLSVQLSCTLGCILGLPCPHLKSGILLWEHTVQCYEQVVTNELQI